MTEEERIDDFVVSCNDYRRWFMKAQEIFDSAEVLEAAYSQAEKSIQETSSGIAPKAFSALPSAIFLFATAIELFVKSLIVSQQGAFDVKGRLLWGRSGHKLRELCGLASIVLSGQEESLLELLEDFIADWGRYPVSKSSGKWRKPINTGQEIKIEGIQPLFTWPHSNNQAIKAFLSEKVTPQIPKIKW